MVIAIVLLIFLGVMVSGPIMSNVEQPKYQVISSDHDIEVRAYSPVIIAEVHVPGGREIAISQGFKLLSNYIFGNNSSSSKIAMTAPVQQEASGDTWKISFIMPFKYSISNLPKPNNPKISLVQIPPIKYAVIRFSGTSSPENLTKHEKKLLENLKMKKINCIGTFKYAFYNPPWTLPFMRRNEIMLKIVE